jgi:hypothetical protein
MRDTYWDATSQQSYRKLDSGVDVVVSQHFQSQGQLAGVLVCPSTVQGGVVSKDRNQVISVAAIISFSAVAILLVSMAVSLKCAGYIEHFAD